jgi:citrate lyase subunit beta/citryl-CoA lyase
MWDPKSCLHPERRKGPSMQPRSILFVSPLSERHLAKAVQSGADAIQLDLEDAITPADKPAARARLSEAIAGLRRNGATEVVVRVNAPWLLAIEDITAAVAAGADCITLPKVETSGRVSVVSEFLDELEARMEPRPQPTRLLILVESARGLEALPQVLRASRRVAAVTLGPEDFSKDIGGTTAMAANEWANIAVLTAARSAGVTPLGFPGSIGIVDDLALFRAQVARARDLGFGGAAVIHPAQVAICNEVFTPTDAEVTWARRIVDAARTATAGAFLLDGKLIDAPHIAQAEQLLGRVSALR